MRREGGTCVVVIRYKMEVMSLQCVLKQIAFALWQAPQWITGAFTAGLLCVTGRVVSCNRRVMRVGSVSLRLRVYRMVTRKGRIYGWSLAGWIFLRTPCIDGICTIGAEQYERVVRHEAGHSRQSLSLGWLYLPVIALPSLIVTGVSPRLAKRCYFERFLMDTDA